MDEILRLKIRELDRERFRFSSWEKNFLISLKRKKKEEELSAKQVFWIEDLWGRLLKQKGMKQ